LLLLASLLFASCGAAGTANLNRTLDTSRQPIVAPVGHPVPTPRWPSALPVAFSHVPPGTYAVHLHSICNGGQAYHIAYLPNLVVGASHSGQVVVPTSDFGRGWCVIVYSNASLQVVLVTQRI
jgi:hypothetical protein